jgi:hypothetical protein
MSGGAKNNRVFGNGLVELPSQAPPVNPGESY